LTVERRWVEQWADSFWSYCIDYLESSGAPHFLTRESPVRNKVDYRERLSPEDFAVFARLREIRKDIAQAEAVPVYTVFTNEQLARMVQARATTKAALERIAGVGDAPREVWPADPGVPRTAVGWSSGKPLLTCGKIQGRPTSRLIAKKK
jgi:hypothetical protein